MIENRPWVTAFSHILLVLGVLAVVLPLWLAFVASTHPPQAVMSRPIPLLPGPMLWENYALLLTEGVSAAGGTPVWRMLLNSLIMALSIAIGKIAISLLSAYAVVYFRFPFRMAAFWIIFLTLMLPVEVRIVPTFAVVANLSLLDSYVGLSLPLIASATATFLFRQFFLTVPDEYLEAARIDGAGPWRFFRDILLPLSRTNIAALFVILFIYGWNQYLWPFLITTDENFYTVVMAIQRLLTVPDSEPLWHMVMAMTMVALVPPVLVVIAMQKLFVKGLTETEK
ncbi:MAG: sn-glycerol-3-phosphate ABC transporter permease UgpE [Rhodospirillaceae bacterium]